MKLFYCFVISVLPIPEYPVVNGQTDHQRVVIQSSDGTASVKCTMDNVRPAISLEVSRVPNGISMTTISSTLNNSDGTYNVSLDTTLKIRNGHPVGVYKLLCRVASKFAPWLKSVITISLVVHGKFLTILYIYLLHSLLAIVTTQLHFHLLHQICW